ncbi:hypothetical protein VTI28DRAFT_9777 [Corynascus sepedonium]
MVVSASSLSREYIPLSKITPVDAPPWQHAIAPGAPRWPPGGAIAPFRDVHNSANASRSLPSALIRRLDYPSHAACPGVVCERGLGRGASYS